MIGLPPVTTSARTLPASISSASATAGTWPTTRGSSGRLAGPGRRPRSAVGPRRAQPADGAVVEPHAARPVERAGEDQQHPPQPLDEHAVGAIVVPVPHMTASRPGRARTLVDQSLEQRAGRRRRPRRRARSTVNGASAGRSASTSLGSAPPSLTSGRRRLRRGPRGQRWPRAPPRRPPGGSRGARRRGPPSRCAAGRAPTAPATAGGESRSWRTGSGSVVP